METRAKVGISVSGMVQPQDSNCSSVGASCKLNVLVAPGSTWNHDSSKFGLNSWVSAAPRPTKAQRSAYH
jgi:hypothetical protein